MEGEAASETEKAHDNPPQGGKYSFSIQIKIKIYYYIFIDLSNQ